MAVVPLGFAGTAIAEDEDENSEPAILSASAETVTATSAGLRAYVNPGGLSTTVRFQYGTTTAYGSATASASAGDSSSWQAVSATVEGLQAATTYHYRAVATNAEGTTYGSARSFTTSAAPGGGTEGSSGTGDGGDTSSGPGSHPAPQEGEDGPYPDAEAVQTVALGPTHGVVRVRRPGRTSFVRLSDDAELPSGSEVDARDGAVALTSALPSGETQTGEFGGGRFVIRTGRRGYVNLHLRGRICPRHRARRRGEGVAVAARRQGAGRRLWGRDKRGRFRTHGKNSHATVRGTRWLVEDRCDGTLTRVSEGAVVVRDFASRKRKLVKAGEHYLARSGR